MAQRILDAAFWDDEDIASLALGERLLFICMVTDVSLSDDYGRLPASPKTLKKHAFGYDDDVRVEQVLAWRDSILQKCRNVVLYTVGGQDYIFLKNFAKWQRLRHHRQSNLPEYHAPAELCGNPPALCGTLPKSDGNFRLDRVEPDRIELDILEQGRAEAPQTAEIQPPVEETPPATQPEVSSSSSFTAKAICAYEGTIGLVSGAHQADEIREMLADLETRKIESWWDPALQIATDQNKRSWAYVRGILRNSLASGTPPNNGGNAQTVPRKGGKRVVTVIDSETHEEREVEVRT